MAGSLQCTANGGSAGVPIDPITHMHARDTANLLSARTELRGNGPGAHVGSRLASVPKGADAEALNGSGSPAQ